MSKRLNQNESHLTCVRAVYVALSNKMDEHIFTAPCAVCVEQTFRHTLYCMSLCEGNRPMSDSE